MKPRRLRCFGLGTGEGQGRAEAGPCAPQPLALGLANGGSRVSTWSSRWRKRICLTQPSTALLGLFLRSAAQELPGRTVLPSWQLLSCGFPFPLAGASGRASHSPRGPEPRSDPGSVRWQGAMCVRRSLPFPVPLCLPRPRSGMAPPSPLEREVGECCLRKSLFFAAAKHRRSRQTRSVYIQLPVGIASSLMVIKERKKSHLLFK